MNWECCQSGSFSRARTTCKANSSNRFILFFAAFGWCVHRIIVHVTLSRNGEIISDSWTPLWNKLWLRSLDHSALNFFNRKISLLVFLPQSLISSWWSIILYISQMWNLISIWQNINDHLGYFFPSSLFGIQLSLFRDMLLLLILFQHDLHLLDLLFSSQPILVELKSLAHGQGYCQDDGHVEPFVVLLLWLIESLLLVLWVLISRWRILTLLLPMPLEFRHLFIQTLNLNYK